jgi:hypothetical protein
MPSSLRFEVAFVGRSVFPIVAQRKRAALIGDFVADRL